MKIGFFITARLKSTRLPFKILKDLNGKTVIERIIERAKRVRGISEIVLCTSANPQDKPLVDIAKKNDIYYFNGDDDDVLRRLLCAAKFFGTDYFLSVTADNPLFSVYYSNLIVDLIKRDNADFVKVVGLPIGTATQGLKTDALEVVCRIKESVDTEIWGYLIDRPEVFNIGIIKAACEVERPNLRLTLDYKEDYEVISSIYHNFSPEEIFDLNNVVSYLDRNADVVKINRNCVQRDLDKKTKEEINRFYIEKSKEIKKIKNEIYKKRPDRK